MRQLPPTPGRTSAEAPGSARHGAREQAAQRRGHGDAADARRERAEQRRAADRKPSARGRCGPFHALTVPPAPELLQTAHASSPKLHESPVRRMSPLFVAITIARSRPSPSTRRTGTSASTQPSSWSARTRDLDVADAAHLDGVRRREQSGPHRRVVPRDEEGTRAEAPPRAPRRATRAAIRRGGRDRPVPVRCRACARPARCRRSRSTTSSAGRPWPCWPAASGPSGRAAPRSRRPRR